MKSRALRIAVASMVGGGLLLAAPFAMARDVNWSVSIGLPGPAVVYAPPPVVYVQPQPVYIQPQPVYVQPQPVYVESGPVVQYGRVYYYYEAPPRHHYRQRHDGHRRGQQGYRY